MSNNKKLNMAQGIEYPVRRLMSLGDGCKYLKCSRDLIEDLIALGEIPIIRFGQPPGKGKKERRKRWIDIRDLDELIESKKETVGERGVKK